MTMTSIVPGTYAIPVGIVNVFLIDAGDLTLIDTGMPGSAERILAAVRQLGRPPTDIRHILLTHLHADHTGSLKALKEATGATTHMHPADAALIRRGEVMRTARPGPGILRWLLFRLSGLRVIPARVEAATVEHELQDGQVLPFAGDLQVIYTPGHTQGHVAFLWPREGGVLFAGDSASNMGRLGPGILYEDYAEGVRSLAHVSRLNFDTACFSHGPAIIGNAHARFRQKWGRSGDPAPSRKRP